MKIYNKLDELIFEGDDLSHADLSNANLSNANLRGADLSAVKAVKKKYGENSGYQKIIEAYYGEL